MTLDERLGRLLNCLTAVRTRATYGAVGQALGVHHRTVAHLLRKRGPSHQCSWVVLKRTREPGYPYADAEKHPDLYRTSRVLWTGVEIETACPKWER